MMRRAVVLVTLVVILAAFNWEVAKKERLLREGTTILLELAPVDPRSLMQGDYMRLDYAVARQMSSPSNWPSDGKIVVATDADGVAQYVRGHTEGTPLAANEHLLLYRRRSGRMRIGTDAFFFQEGHADRYTGARYGELRVDSNGDSLLVGLRDRERRSLGSGAQTTALP